MARDRSSSRRVLRTVLFTDIVKSTERLTEVGDAGWRALVGKHHALVRGAIRRHHGREVDNAGDGFLIAFEQPLDAVNCAIDVMRRIAPLGIESRAGIHTGEVERIGPKIGGIAVHTAARIMALAAPTEILVSSTVQELIAGSDTELVDYGVHDLRGVPGERRLFSVVVPAADRAEDPSGGVLAGARARSTRRVAGLAIGLVGLVVVALAGVVLLGGRAAALPTGADTVVALARASGAQVAGAHVGRGPASMAFDGDTLWIANLDGATVSRVEVGSASHLAIGNVGSRPAAIAADAGSVWVADAFADRVVEIEPGTAAISGSISGVRARALAIAFDSVWLADEIGDRLVRVDPATRTAAAEVVLSTASGPAALAAGGDRLWVASRRSGEVVAVDPRTDQLTGNPIGFDGASAVAAAADGTVWVISTARDALARIDTTAMRVADRFVTCDNPVALAVADDGVWVACSIGRRLWHLGLDGELRREVLLDGLPTAVAIAGERVWVTLRGD